MSTPLRLVDAQAPQPRPDVASPLVRAEHDQKFVVRHADRELGRLAATRPDLRDRFTALRDQFARDVDQMGRDFRQAGGRDYLSFAQSLARIRRELSSSLRSVAHIDASPTPATPIDPPSLPFPGIQGRLDVRG